MCGNWLSSSKIYILLFAMLAMPDKLLQHIESWNKTYVPLQNKSDALVKSSLISVFAKQWHFVLLHWTTLICCEIPCGKMRTCTYRGKVPPITLIDMCSSVIRSLHFLLLFYTTKSTKFPPQDCKPCNSIFLIQISRQETSVKALVD